LAGGGSKENRLRRSRGIFGQVFKLPEKIVLA